MVPTRVVERMVDGNYRVRGMQSFMIGQREYKVIVAGIVRAEDFNEEGINASQLLDSSFDIVSAKGAEMVR
jgi:flagellar L-ring protein precursor FlgH